MKPLRNFVNPWAMIFMVALLGIDFSMAQSLPASSISETQTTTPKTFVTARNDFDRNLMLNPLTNSGSRNGFQGFQFLNPNRFSMHQSYSLNFGSSGNGSVSSGLYLNTLSYQLAAPLTLSMDIGFHSPIYNSMSNMQGPSPWNGSLRPDLVLPRIGLDYKPTEHTSISLQLINGNDAMKAYGSPFGGPSASPFWRGF